MRLFDPIMELEDDPSGDPSMKRLRNWLLFTIVILIWSSNWPVMKIGLRYIDPLSFVFQRLLFASMAMLPLLILLRRNIPRERGILLKLVLLGIIGGLAMLCTNTGLTREESGISAVLTYTQPLFVFCLAVPFLREEAKPSRFLGVFIGFSGVILLSAVRISWLKTSYFSLLFLIGAFLWAVSIVYYKKFLSGIDPIIVSIFQMSVGAFQYGILHSILGRLYFPQDIQYYYAIFYVSIFGSSIAFPLWTILIKEEEATVISSSSFLIPLLAMFFGWLILKENIGLNSIIGAALILVGVYLVNR